MLLSVMRQILRRRLHDDTDENWQDQDLNQLINSAFQQVQKKILAVEATPWIAIDTRDIVSGTNTYRKPPSMWYEIELAIADVSIAGGYRPLTRRDYARVATSEVGSDEYYAHLGQFFFLSPNPSTSVTTGLRITHVPILSLDQDDDEPGIPAPLHMAIVVWAEIFAKGETEESVEKLQAQLEMLLGDLDRFYYQHGKEAPSLLLDIDNGQGVRLSNSNFAGNGRYSR